MRGLYDKAFVEQYCHGFDALCERLKDWPLDRVAEVTWCDAEQIAKAARNLRHHQARLHRVGQRHRQLGNNTFQATRSLLILMALSGNLDVPGGNVFWPAPKLDYPELWGQAFARTGCQAVGRRPVQGAQHDALCLRPPADLFRTMLSDEPYPVKTFIVVGNNTVTCFPNSAKIIEALKKLDFFVVQDIFMTPTAALADVVLPAAGNLERDEPRLHLHIKGPGATFMDTVSRKLVEIGERKSDWEFIIALGRKLGFEEYFPALEVFADEALKPMGITWAELKSKDYVEVPIEYRKYERMGFGTPTGKFEIYSTIMEEWGYDPLPDHVEPPESPVSTPERYKDYPLILNTGAKQPMYWHSQGRQLRSLRRLSPEPLVELNDKTAAELGIKRGEYCWDRDRARAASHEGQPAQAHPSQGGLGAPWLVAARSRTARVRGLRGVLEHAHRRRSGQLRYRARIQPAQGLAMPGLPGRPAGNPQGELAR